MGSLSKPSKNSHICEFSHERNKSETTQSYKESKGRKENIISFLCVLAFLLCALCVVLLLFVYLNIDPRLPILDHQILRPRENIHPHPQTESFRRGIQQMSRFHNLVFIPDKSRILTV
jgi:hypothetical protein